MHMELSVKAEIDEWIVGAWSLLNVLQMDGVGAGRVLRSEAYSFLESRSWQVSCRHFTFGLVSRKQLGVAIYAA